ncbi:hypothetical protein HAX54_024314 [Datura stramonium]|uniref:Uncharacterized protein n=1 Tax=Datura stramonium TaxID=4076 RepID=A0ABS8UZZ9_DATST|nr:hypothetical protein [Datura stramonium]
MRHRVPVTSPQVLGMTGIAKEKKCAWLLEHEDHICVNFEKKVGHVLADLFLKACRRNKNPRWVLLENWSSYLGTARSIQGSSRGVTSERRPKSTKEGSLHMSKAQSYGNVRNFEDPVIWVEPRDELSYVERIWLDLVGGSSRYELLSGIEGLCSSHDSELMDQGTILAMKWMIAKLSSQVEASRARKRMRNIEFMGIKS